MLVQFAHFNTLTAQEQDSYLAKGWFRNSNTLLCLRMVCVDEQLFSLLKIRLPLQNYKMTKSLRKIWNKNKNFEVKIAKAKITQEKEVLYKEHLHRFKGHISPSLADFFIDSFDNQFFDTYEVSIFDEGKLIAFSFFDKGAESIASIMGIFDHDYSKHSLGIYTMLCEIQNAISEGKNFYYPGYVLHKCSSFDYKLRLGNYQYYTWKKWVEAEKFSKSNLDIYKLNKAIKIAEQALQDSEIAYEKKLYPYFSFGYIEDAVYDFVQSPVCLIFKKNNLSFLLIEYFLDSRMYRLSRACVASEFQEMLDKMNEKNTRKTSKKESLELNEIIYYQNYILEHKNIDEILSAAAKEHLLPFQLRHQILS